MLGVLALVVAASSWQPQGCLYTCSFTCGNGFSSSYSETFGNSRDGQRFVPMCTSGSGIESRSASCRNFGITDSSVSSYGMHCTGAAAPPPPPSPSPPPPTDRQSPPPAPQPPAPETGSASPSDSNLLASRSAALAQLLTPSCSRPAAHAQLLSPSCSAIARFNILPHSCPILSATFSPRSAAAMNIGY